MNIVPNTARVNIDDESLRRFGSNWRVYRQQTRSVSITSNGKGIETEEGNEQENANPLIDPELHRLITEWRISKTREDYKPYSEDELRKFGEIWKVGIPKYAPTEREIQEKLKELETIHINLSRIIDKFYELAWIRNSQDYWHHIWLTLHLAGATVEEVWEIAHSKWPKLLTEMKSFGSKEVEKLQRFIETSEKILIQCDSVLCDFDFEKERACCLKLCGILRGFPIAPRWKCMTSWEAQDRLLRRQRFGILSRVINWF